MVLVVGECDPRDSAVHGVLELIEGLRPRSIGVGTGSTVGRVISDPRVSSILSKAMLVSSSLDTLLKLNSMGFTVLDQRSVPHVDVYIDGADEVDRNGDMVKGRGGALLGEKVLAYNSMVNVFVVGEDKLVDRLGSKKPVPVEVVPEYLTHVLESLTAMGLRHRVRSGTGKDGPVLSDWRGVIVDLDTGPIKDPYGLELTLKSIPGIVETGLFLGYADYIVVGYRDCTWRINRYERRRRWNI